MNILGLNVFHADSSCVLVQNGNLISGIEEERLERIKHFSGFPFQSIKFCLSENNLSLSEIDLIGVNFNTKYNFNKKLFFSLKNFFSLNILSKLQSILKKSSIKNILENEFNTKNIPKIYNIPHHLSHISSSYLVSGYDEAIGFSFDGSGDFSTIEIYMMKNNKINLLEKNYFPHSIGVLYQAITQFLGFKSYGEEYKVMGLAAYGHPIYINKFKKLIDINIEKENFFQMNLRYFNHHKNILSYHSNSTEVGIPYFENLYSRYLLELFGEPRNYKNDITQKHMDIAASLQYIIEEIVVNKLNQIHKVYSIPNLCLAGGCAFNSALNGKILKNTSFKNIFLSSNPGDAGGAAGAALYLSNEFDKNFINKKNTNPYIGSVYTDEEIYNFINNFFNHNINLYNVIYYKNYSELNSEVVNKIEQKKIIGWFQGKMEFGPRALGNRSILADPRVKNMREIINFKIKKREEFRPFAPSILEEFANNYFEMNAPSPFMSFVFNAKNNTKLIAPSVVHVDGTSRVQTVNVTDNKLFYDLIKAFYNKTGLPILLNTSLNVNEPICETPNSALEIFVKTSLDCIVLGKYVISKKD